MAAPPPPTPILNTQTSILRTFSDFLTVAIHTILYTRGLYPESTFITTRKYNFPVHQNRHPSVCNWINDAVASVHELIVKNAVRRVVVVIHDKTGNVMERFMFDVERFPVVEKGMMWVEVEEKGEDVTASENGKENSRELEIVQSEGRPPTIVDIEEQLRATIRRLDYSGSRLKPLPADCTYTLAIELKDDPAAMPPIGHPQPWIPSPPPLQTGDKGKSQIIGSALGGAKSIPVRLVEAGEFILETWIEEGKAKYQPRVDDGDEDAAD